MKKECDCKNDLYQEFLGQFCIIDMKSKGTKAPVTGKIIKINKETLLVEDNYKKVLVEKNDISTIKQKKEGGTEHGGNVESAGSDMGHIQE